MATDVHRNDEQSRYELLLDGSLVGIADYYERDGTVVFPHTEVAYAHRGKGLGEVLVRAALDDVAASGRSVEAPCWFVARFIDDNPEYRPLLAA